ncbi:MAG: mechanosensitive ion channel family protein [Psychrobacillus sp.]|uniref:mechanosensitive ion channel family protein n=1 Tax=unclassified Psychrobacillus TaxID=2636677 RepID=UPI00203A781E|nr:mechanosensitive ion channel family protein [Psychrobacillus sp. MER TA 171]MCM3358758.1 mechanosensitive ion channel family protein [Psychrobacillus sp. MER TA 171]
MDLSIFMSYVFWKNLGISIAILLVFLILRKIFSKYVFNLLIKLSDKTPTDALTHLFRSFEKPIQWMFIIVGIYVAASFFPHFDETNKLFLVLIRVSYIILISWGLYNMSSDSSTFFTKMRNRYNLDIDDILIPFLSKALRVIIVVISISVVAEEFGYNVSGFVAGLGLGGVAIAFAAKDALSHLLGGFVIITEKPFRIGDWILTPDVEGTIEEITFRSTKIRTFSQAIVTVPNAMIANGPITNWSKMGKRQINFNLRVSQETPKEKLELVVKEIEQLVSKHTGVHPETIFVKFDAFKENGYDIFLYFFTNTTVWAEFLKVKEDINFGIMEILEREGVSIALQSRKVYVDNELIQNEPKSIEE